MRPIEVLLVTLGVLVIVLVGFAPCFPRNHRNGGSNMNVACSTVRAAMLRSRRASIEWAIIHAKPITLMLRLSIGMTISS